MAHIAGVVQESCRRIDNDRGYLQEVQRADQGAGFAPAQVYLTQTLSGVVKAWYRHRRQWDSFHVLMGTMQLVLLDDRPDSPTYRCVAEFRLAADVPSWLKLPPGIWHGFRALAGDLLVLHMNSHPFDFTQPDEDRLPVGHPDMPDCWSVGASGP